MMASWFGKSGREAGLGEGVGGLGETRSDSERLEAGARLRNLKHP